MVLAQHFCRVGSACWKAQQSLTLANNDWLDILIGQGGLLSVVCQPICNPNFSLMRGVGKKWITELGCEIFFCNGHTHILMMISRDGSKTRLDLMFGKNTNTSLLCSRSGDSWKLLRKCTYWFGTMLVYVMPGSVISPITRLLVPISPWRQCAKLSGIVPFAANWETTETEFGPNPINPSVASSELAKFPVRTFPHLLPMHPWAGSKLISSYTSLSPDHIGKACHWKSFIR